MEQVNFRVTRDVKRVIDLMAKVRGMSVSEFAKRTILKEIEPIRVDLAFELLEAGKIGRKQAWLLSGLGANEFLVEWTRRGAEETVPEDLIEWELDIMNNVDWTKFKRD